MKELKDLKDLFKSKEMKKFMRRMKKDKKKQIANVEALPLYKTILPFNLLFKKKKIVRIKPPFDKRNKNPKKNYGIGAMQIWFILKGRRGAVQILLSTNYYPISVIDEYTKKGTNLFSWGFTNPYNPKSKSKLKDTFECQDVGYHSIKRPNYLEKEDKRVCDINDCGYCYYDGSSLRGSDDKIGELFMEKGEEAIWKYLEEEYDRVFKDKKPYGLGLLAKITAIILSKGEKNGKKTA